MDNTINGLLFFLDEAGLGIVGFRVLDKLIVIHEDTLPTYEVREWEPARYTPTQPFWPAAELPAKLTEWGQRTKQRIDLGWAQQIAGMEKSNGTV